MDDEHESTPRGESRMSTGAVTQVLRAQGTSASRSRALLIAVLAAVVGVSSYIVGVRSAIGQRAEALVLGEAVFSTTPPAPLNLVSIPSVAVVFLLLGFVAFLVHGPIRAIGVTVVPAIGIVAAQFLKQQFLIRPGLFELDAPNTFPSGHMSIFVLFVAACIWTVPDRARAVVALGGSALMGIVAWQLLEYGWHRPSDVLGAMMLGVLTFAVMTIIAPIRMSRRPSGIVAVRVILIGVGMLLVVAALVVAASTFWVETAGLMILAGSLGAIGAAALSGQALITLSS